MQQEMNRIREELETADAIVIGAGAGLSTDAGFTYSGARMQQYFADFMQKYGFKDMYAGGFYPFPTPEEQWAYWSRYIFINRYTDVDNGTYKKLFQLVKDKNYFVLTTNVDHQFQKAGFDRERLFYTQGDYGLWQCSEPCHMKTYDNEAAVRAMYAEQKDMRIPSALIPYCPVCGKPMSMNLRADDTFVEDEGWHRASAAYYDFLKKHEKDHVLYLELGVGGNTPVIVKYPFWQMTLDNGRATYACLNFGEADCPEEIAAQSVCIADDIGKIFRDISG
jgi:NAD-dependent SIR2 family protein deacetylase